MQKKEIQRARVRKYFIDATAQIIEQEGIENVTIRKIADLAGYNSATLYNYFGELSHLIFFAAMRFLKKYTDDLPNYIKKSQNPLEEYLMIWECFCKHSFQQPQIYYAVFCSNLGDLPQDILENYYGFFPKDLAKIPDMLLPMLHELNLIKRSEISLRRCIEGGYVKPEDAHEINELTVLIYHGMLSLFLNRRRSYTVEEATQRVVTYIKMIILNANKLVSVKHSVLG